MSANALKLSLKPLKPDFMFVVVVSLVGLGFRKRFSSVSVDFLGFRGFSLFFLVHPFITLFTLHCCSTGGENYVGRCSPEASSPLQGPWYLVELKDLDEDTRVELE